jgi:site-specific DNA-methyltransferase (adenine-specific)
MSDTYSSLYNPDVLSTLANLSSDEVFTPPHIVNQMLDMLPQEIFSDKNAKFLDPATKSGVFLREIAKRLLEGLKDQIPDLQERIDHVFHNQIFGIAITEMTSLLSRRSLYCSKYPNSKYSITYFNNIEGNIRFKDIEHKWNRKKCTFCGANKKELDRDDSMEAYAYEYIHVNDPKEILKMKFDVIIGNPPYQLNDGGGTGSSAVPIYQKFIEQSMKLKPKYLTMIIPARWFTGGKGLDSFRATMIKDRRIKTLHDYINASDCFPNVSIEGGVCYFLYDRDYNGKAEIHTHKQDGTVDKSLRFLDEGMFDIFVRDEKVLDVVKTVLQSKTKSFSNIVYPRNTFGLGNSSKIITNTIKNIKVFGRFNGKRDYKYVDRFNLEKNIDIIDKYKLYISKADGAAGQIGNPIPARIIGKAEEGLKQTVCTETFLVVGPFESEIEMKNAKDYMKTKFFRFLVGARKNKNMTQNTYQFVPYIDFKQSWDDTKLFAKFKLSEHQVDYINRMISDYDETSSEEIEGDDNDE